DMWQPWRMKHLFFCLLLVVTPAVAQTNEARTAALVDALKADPAALRILLSEMPKGGDLHHHLDGSVWAEDLLKWADADGYCIDKASRTLTPPPCTPAQLEARGLLERDPKFYSSTVDALSFRDFF